MVAISFLKDVGQEVMRHGPWVMGDEVKGRSLLLPYHHERSE
jgi:hypothetical protein